MAVLCYLPIKIARPKLDRELKMCCIHLLVVMRKCLCGDMPVRSALKANKERTNKQKHISNQTVFCGHASWTYQWHFCHITFFFLGLFSKATVLFWKPPRRVIYVFTLWACICNFPERIYCDRFLLGEQAWFEAIVPDLPQALFNRAASYRWSGLWKSQHSIALSVFVV